MYSYLAPDLTVDVNVLADFEKMVKLSFGGTGLYPQTNTAPVPSSDHCHSFPLLAPSICISCKLEKGKERCGSLLGLASIVLPSLSIHRTAFVLLLWLH
jgi:hypothetical protein